MNIKKQKDTSENHKTKDEIGLDVLHIVQVLENYIDYNNDKTYQQ
jgi:hypothetical protein